MKKTKKIALILMTVVLMAVCFVFGASALDAEGQCGDNVYWNFNSETGELVISGEGEMYDDGDNYRSPFLGKDEIKSVTIEKGVTSIGLKAFDGCRKMNNVSIADTVTVIGEGAFEECFNLTSIVIPDSVTTIEPGAFNACFRLKDVKLGKGISSIGMAAFEKCLSLENISIPESVTTIEMGAFYDCFSLTDMIIPSHITSVGYMAFTGMLFPHDIYVESLNASIDEYAFGYTVMVIEGIEKEEFVEKFIFMEEIDDYETRKEYSKEVEKYYVEVDVETFRHGTLYCHEGSTTEAYAIENNVDYVLMHFFKGDWIYDYDNMIRYRKCIHCDELETEKLESTENGDVEIVEPVDPDTDFEVDEIEGDKFLVVEETVTNGIEGNAEILRAFDITLKNKDGVHVQPDGTVKVKLPLDWTKDGIYKVYRVNDDGTLTDMNAYRQGSHMVFETDHFSIYVIVDLSEKTEPEEPETPDVPAEPDTSGCGCLCHKTGTFFNFLNTLFRFLIKLLGVFPTCDCGIAHY